MLIIALALLLDNPNIVYVVLFSALHELGHLICLILFRQPTKEINISYYGIGLKYKANLPFIKELILYSSGLFVNFLFVVCDVCKNVNFALLLINILPIYPLDGGRVFKLVLNKAFSLNISDKIYFAISIAVVIILMFYSIYSKNISLVLISIYSLIFAVNNTID